MLPVSLSTIFSDNDDSLPLLNSGVVHIIEHSTLLSTVDKISLIAIFLHKKWITELDIGLQQKDKYINLLDTLHLPWRLNEYTTPPHTKWIQVATNQATLDYVFERGKNLSELEAGLLYGYPLTHVLGFTGCIPRAVKATKNIAAFYLAGTFSHNFKNEEQQYFDDVWQKIAKASPVIAKQAKRLYVRQA